jgi:hypothetical protein
MAQVDGDGDEVEGEVYDSSDFEDDTAMFVSRVPAAGKAPDGYKYLPCPEMDTDEHLLALVGKPILHAWDTSDFLGWYVGRISARGVSARDLRHTPEANFVVTYDKKTTKNKKLHGRVASSLTPGRYGIMQWWVLMEAV